ncbi:putative Lymphoid-specific helicase [Glarea lozoyensis 74030]|uniref:Putative Lymphoid-specific helicase n=1 Tax=Glarea lozoyensis (strain ATCC 74030 / MF5533) TaxID=1104152 RepID=H0EEQ2_GLAL7|nr:putative Lymphoid-specific helicase [Glarea lozoyensis 74030]
MRSSEAGTRSPSPASRLPTSTPSSPPDLRDEDELEPEFLSKEDQLLYEEERAARAANEKAEAKKRAAALKKKKKQEESKEEREKKSMKLEELLKKSGRPTKRFPVVCTSPEMVLRDFNDLTKIMWEFIIIDEGHRMKNNESKLFQVLKTFTSASRLLITGTPLQNNMKELWSLLNFLLPTIFIHWEQFEEWFDFSDLQDEEGTAQFIADKQNKEIKADVEHLLPKKREYILYAPMTKDQTELYNAITDKKTDTRKFLEDKILERLTATAGASNGSSVKAEASDDDGSDDEKPLALRPRPKAETKTAPKNAFQQMMQKKSATSSRASSKGSLKRKSPADVETPVPKSAKSSRHSTPATSVRRTKTRGRKVYKEADASDEDELSDDEFEQKLVEEAAELEKKNNVREVAGTKEELELAKMVELAIQLDLLEDYARDLRKWNVCRIDGSVAQDDRRLQIKEFNENPEFRLFLLSTRAGGQGINLASADTVILFDSDWNPQQDLQAQDRAHRIGQKNPVVIFRLATKNTVEEGLLSSAEGKRRLEKAVIKKTEFGKGPMTDDTKMQLELKQLLLKDGMVFTGTGKNKEEILSDKDLDILCDRSDAAYERAAKGLGDTENFKVIETKYDGIASMMGNEEAEASLPVEA